MEAKRLEREGKSSRGVRLSFPTMEILSEQFYLADNLFGVVQNSQSKTVAGAKLVVFYFRANARNATEARKLALWEQNVYNVSVVCLQLNYLSKSRCRRQRKLVSS